MSSRGPMLSLFMLSAIPPTHLNPTHPHSLPSAHCLQEVSSAYSNPYGPLSLLNTYNTSSHAHTRSFNNFLSLHYVPGTLLGARSSPDRPASSSHDGQANLTMPAFLPTSHAVRAPPRTFCTTLIALALSQ